MATMLDLLNDPQTAVMLSLGTGMMQGRNLGQGLMLGMNGAAQTAQALSDRQRAQALEDLKAGLLRAQIGETEAQAVERKAQADKMQQAAQRAGLFQQALLGAGTTSPQQAMAANGGPTNAAAAAIGAPRQIDYQGLTLQFPEMADQIAKIAGARNLGRDKIASWQEFKGQDGNPWMQGKDDYGNNVGQPIPKPVKMTPVQQGDRVGFVNEYTQTAPMPIFQSTDNKANNAVAWANNALANNRFDFEQSQANKPTYDAERGIVVDTRQGSAAPVMLNGQPIGAKPKELTESQANAASFAMRAQNALDNLGKLQTISTTGYAASQLPLGAGNWIMGANDQQAINSEKQFIAAVLRKESGAAISMGEYTSYGNQFFPRPGDSKEALAQKAVNRQVAMQGLMAQAGPGASQVGPALDRARAGQPGDIFDAADAILRGK